MRGACVMAGVVMAAWGLVGCGPPRERANRMRQQIAQAEAAYLEAVHALDQQDLEAAALKWDDLHLLTRSPDKDVVEMLIDGRTAMMTAQNMQRLYRLAIQGRLEVWHQAYLESQLDLARLDAFLQHVKWQDWSDIRESWQEEARKKAAGQLYLRFAGDPLLPGVRGTLVKSILALAQGRLHTGYGLGDDVPRKGDLIITAQADWLNWTTPEGGVLGKVPSSCTLSANAPDTEDWLTCFPLTAKVPAESLPANLVYEDRSAGYAALATFRDEADRLMTEQLAARLSTPAP